MGWLDTLNDVVRTAADPAFDAGADAALAVREPAGAGTGRRLFGVLAAALDPHQALRVLESAADPDRALQVATSALIEGVAARSALGRAREAWRPGKPLKLYLAGYVGARNTGADVRVEEMIRQLRVLFGDDNLELTLPAFDAALCSGYFRAVRHQTMPVVFPRFLAAEVPQHHGVVACEGSMFKSKFSNALSTMMAGALGLAAAEGKLAVGYGAEAGEMDPGLRRFVEKQCRHALVLCRNEASRTLLGRLGIRTGPGADTAWTFDPGPLERGVRLLRDAGWDGQRPVLAVCPINPFWWPVKPDLGRAVAHRLNGAHAADHYKSVYFHHRSDDADRRYRRYIDALAEAIIAAGDERPLFPVIIGMEQIDRGACEDLAARLPSGAPVFASDEHDMYELVALLRSCSALLSSRFHAIVTSMPAGVPSGGVTMDERIHNLLLDRGDEDLLLRVDDDDLGERAAAVVRRLLDEPDPVRHRILAAVPRQLRSMGEMGMALCDEAQRVYPDLELPERPRTWLHHLPALGPSLERILEEHT